MTKELIERLRAENTFAGDDPCSCGGRATEYGTAHKGDCAVMVIHDLRVYCGRGAKEIELQTAQIAELRRVIEWALGEGDDFPDWPDTVTITGNPKYWWRTELRKRYDKERGNMDSATKTGNV